MEQKNRIIELDSAIITLKYDSHDNRSYDYVIEVLLEQRRKLINNLVADEIEEEIPVHKPPKPKAKPLNKVMRIFSRYDDSDDSFEIPFRVCWLQSLKDQGCHQSSATVDYRYVG